MADHKKFNCRTISDLSQLAGELHLEIPISEDIQSLLEAVNIKNKKVPNRLVVQPMEGFDSMDNGAPGELSFRRYKRYAAGGSGMIWFEATSIMHSGRSNPRQLMLTHESLPEFQKLVEMVRLEARKIHGSDFDPFLVLQLTHSGRYSKPEGVLTDKYFSSNPILDPAGHKTSRFTDEELDEIKEHFKSAIHLAEAAGFDSVDIKASHGYLLHEILAAFEDTDSCFDGSYENRTKILKDLCAIQTNLIKSIRLNASDSIPYPHGFGMQKDGSLEYDLTEPVKLIGELKDEVPLWNITAGIPYYNSFVNRPYDRGIKGSDTPPEHPLQGVARLIQITGDIQQKYPDLPMVGSGYSWLRYLIPYVGAGVRQQKKATFIGLGRSSFAYPDAPRDLIEKGEMDRKKVCTACSRCTEFMREGKPSGCAIRDASVYPGLKPEVVSANTLIIGSGAAGLNAALYLWKTGVRNILIVTEEWGAGTSNNAGSDKQTYYKQSLDPMQSDSALEMARDLYNGGSMHGDIALCEAQHSIQAFYHLVELGVPFPYDEYGAYPGYITDHDTRGRATSAGPRTSQMMFAQLAAKVKEHNIPIMDKVRFVRLLTKSDDSGKKVCGAIGVKLDQTGDLVLFNTVNVILATGGPAGIYRTSVYPESQTGSIGVALRAGASAHNLTESQFGIGSVKFRWNLSGSYQQVIPRYYSTDQEGNNKRDFLLDHFSSLDSLCEAIFLKGYQWPFDPRKVENSGSSIIDLLVFRETEILGRRVYMDYTHNPWDFSDNPKFRIDDLPESAHTYLQNSGAMAETPYLRLQQLNAPAIQLYLDNHIDLAKEPLEIAVCAQHNNGGLMGDIWWESDLKHLFPIGEVNGSHGVYRPGGSALNAGQTGGIRAAMRIARKYMQEPPDQDNFLNDTKAQTDEFLSEIEGFTNTNRNLTPDEVTDELRIRMSEFGGLIRNKTLIKQALENAWTLWAATLNKLGIQNQTELAHALQAQDLCMTHVIYLKAIETYIEKGGLSRGSYLVTDDNDIPDQVKLNSGGSFTDQHILEIQLDQFYQIQTSWKAIRPIPEVEHWFEKLWTKFRENE